MGDRIPKRFHPRREMAKDGRLVGKLCARAIEIVENVDSKSLGRQKTCRFGDRGMPSTRTVKRDHSWITAAVVSRNETIKRDRLAAAFKGLTRWDDVQHSTLDRHCCFLRKPAQRIFVGRFGNSALGDDGSDVF